jgi:16S rRNA (cytosine967-C5)-methyltransferase
VKVLEVGKLGAIGGETSGAFDRILVDVPCSNSGVLARRPEARYAGGLDCLVKLQREILEDTLPWLAPGGLLAYSTCSVWPEENERQIEQLLERHAELGVVSERAVLPESGEPLGYHDGGYLAVLRKG